MDPVTLDFRTKLGILMNMVHGPVLAKKEQLESQVESMREGIVMGDTTERSWHLCLSQDGAFHVVILGVVSDVEARGCCGVDNGR